MKIKIPLILILILFLSCSVFSAAKDLSSGTEVLDTINLGDSKELTKLNIKNLYERKAIRDLKEDDNSCSFNTQFFNQRAWVYLHFDSIDNILAYISIYFTDLRFSSLSEKEKFLIETVKPMIIKKYGEPNKTNVPSRDFFGHEEILLFVWELDNYKSIIIKQPTIANSVEINIKKTKLPWEIEEQRKKEKRKETYSQIKGDFKVLCLGDSKELTEDKLKFLEEQEEIKWVSHGDKPRFTASLLEKSIKVNAAYFQDKLYRIFITFPYYSAYAIDYQIKDFVLKELKPLFINLYGRPTNDYDYPNILGMVDGHYSYVSKWVLKQKTIIIGVYEIDAKYAAIIDITDNILLEAKKKDDETQKNNNINKSSNDFN